MKTSIKTLISAALCVIVLSSAAVLPVSAAEQAKSSRRMITPKFKKIVVTGHVDVLLVQNSKTGVIVNQDTHCAKLLKVTQQGETLKITSNQAERVEVTLYVDDIYRIDASEGATVDTFGKLSLKYLQVFLHDNAVADIHATTESLYTVVADQARLNLSGYSGHHALVMSKIAKLSMNDFSALKSEMSYSDAVAMLNSSDSYSK